MADRNSTDGEDDTAEQTRKRGREGEMKKQRSLTVRMQECEREVLEDSRRKLMTARDERCSRTTNRGGRDAGMGLASRP